MVSLAIAQIIHLQSDMSIGVNSALSHTLRKSYKKIFQKCSSNVKNTNYCNYTSLTSKSVQQLHKFYKLPWYYKYPSSIVITYICFKQCEDLISHYHKKKTRNKVTDPDYIHTLEDEIRLAYRWQVSIYKLLPLRLVSRFWGYINNVELPYWLRQPLLLTYIWFYNIDMTEAQIENVKQYKNLGQLFCRKLKSNVRPIDTKSDLVSPVDGRVLHCGLVCADDLEQVKGVKYSLSQFLGPGCERILDLHLQIKRLPPPTKNRSVPNLEEVEAGNDEDALYNSLTLHSTRYNPLIPAQGATPSHRQASFYSAPPVTCVDDNKDRSQLSTEPNEEELVVKQRRVMSDRLCLSPENELYYAIVYLAPGDYHGFHSPVDWLVVHRRHFPGELFSVCPSIVRWIQGLFNFNERVVFTGTWKYGFFSMAAVGATNVGSIKIHIDQDLKTNLKKWKPGTFFDKVFLDPQSANKSPLDGLIYADPYSNSSHHSADGLVLRRNVAKRKGHDSGIVSDEGEDEDDFLSIDKPPSLDSGKPYTEDYVSSSEDCDTSRESLESGADRNGIYINRGDYFGEFNLGSTVVLIFEAPKNFTFDLEFDQTLKMGQSLGRCV